MLDKMKQIWMRWFGHKGEPMCDKSLATVSEPIAMDGKKRFSSLLQRLEEYLFGRYEFRFNVLTEQAEYRKAGEGVFFQVDQRVLNTLCMEAREAGINCWDKDVSRLLLSCKVADFHPFRQYVSDLPEWDGVDRVSELAKRVSAMPIWVNGFHR